MPEIATGNIWLYITHNKSLVFSGDSMAEKTLTMAQLSAMHDEEIRQAMAQHQTRMRLMAARHRSELMAIALAGKEGDFIETLAGMVRAPLEVIAQVEGGGPEQGDALSLIRLLEQVMQDNFEVSAGC